MMIFNGTLKTCNWRSDILIRFWRETRAGSCDESMAWTTAVRQMWFWLDLRSESSCGGDFIDFLLLLIPELLPTGDADQIFTKIPNNFMLRSSNKPHNPSLMIQQQKNFVKIHSYRLRALSLLDHSMCWPERFKVLFMSNLVARQRWMWMCY
jgi:hypothetical protein